MNRPQSELDQIRAAHPEKWAQLAASFKPQRIAEIILTHAAEAALRDAENPPEKIAAAKVKAAQDVVRVHASRAELAHGEYQKLLSEVRAEFPGVEIEILSIPAGDDTDLTGLNKLLEEHRELVAQQNERIKELEAEVDLKAERILQIEDLNTAACAAVAKIESDLKASQAALEAASKKKGK